MREAPTSGWPTPSAEATLSEYCYFQTTSDGASDSTYGKLHIKGGNWGSILFEYAIQSATGSQRLE